MVYAVETRIIENGLGRIDRLDHMETDTFFQQIETACPILESNQPLEIDIAPTLVEGLVELDQRGFQYGQTDQSCFGIGFEQTPDQPLDRIADCIGLVDRKIQRAHNDRGLVETVRHPHRGCDHAILALPPVFDTFDKAR